MSGMASRIAIPRRRSGRHRAGDRAQGRARSRRARRLRSDPGLRSGRLLARHAKACGIKADFAKSNVLACPQPETASLGFGVVSPVSGPRLDRVLRRRGQGRDGGRGRRRGGGAAERDLDRAGRHHIRRPSVVRRAADRHRRERRLHDAVLRRHADRALHAAPERARGDRADHRARTWRAPSARPTRRSSGSASPTPKIAVSGLNPHAGEGGLFGREEIEIIKPAMDAVAAEGLDVVGPVRRRHHVPHAGLRRLRRHAARPGPHRHEADGAERRRGADHRHADPVRLGRARHRPRHRRQGHRQSGGDDRGGADGCRSRPTAGGNEADGPAAGAAWAAQTSARRRSSSPRRSPARSRPDRTSRSPSP